MRTSDGLRQSGIEAVGAIGWGTHFCQFYDGQDELLETLVPYFAAGLEGGEACLWITTEPLTVDRARAALRAAVPDLDDRAGLGGLEIVSHGDWYLQDGTFGRERVGEAWLGRVDQALGRGFAGLRVSGDTAWVESPLWQAFDEYERSLSALIAEMPVLVLCTYPLWRRTPEELIDVVQAHRFTVVRRDGRWQRVENVERAQVDEELANFFNLALEGLCIASLDGYFLRVNPSFERMLGYTAEELTSTPFMDFHHPDDVAATLAAVEQLGAGEDVIRFENRYRHKDGSYRWLQWTSHAVPERGLAYAAARDVTEAREAARRRGLQARIATIFSTVADDEVFNEVLLVVLEALHSPFGIFGYIDDRGVLVEPTMTRQVWDRCEIEDKTICFPPETWGDSGWGTALREQRAVWSNERSPRTPEGHVPIERNIAVPVLDHGETTGLLHVANSATDYTEADARELESIAEVVAPLLRAWVERERAANRIRTLNAELEQRVTERTAELTAANEELEAFTYSVSHDLRAPLRTLDGFSAALLEDYGSELDETARGYAVRIRRGSQHMALLIDDLLSLARLNRHELVPADVDVSLLAAAVAADLHTNEPDRQVDVVVEPGMSARGDATLVRAVLENLLSNAWKFTEPHDRARIEVARSGDAFVVRDDGVGFDPAYADKLFRPFQRLHSSEFPGNGIGLASVQRIVVRHGGRVWAESTPGNGAAFYFTLPARSAP